MRIESILADMFISWHKENEKIKQEIILIVEGVSLPYTKIIINSLCFQKIFKDWGWGDKD